MQKKVRDRIASLRMLKVPRISWRDLIATLGPILLLSALAIAVALHYVRPAPPSVITISSGPDGSTFRNFAEKYRVILARNGITLKILPSQGALDNLKQLTNPDSGVDVAFVQSGIANGVSNAVPAGTSNAMDISDLVSLGSIFYEPLAIFYRSPQAYERLSELKGRRVAVGPEGSGTRVLALALLKANGIEPAGSTKLVDLAGKAAIDALMAGQVDAVFLMGDSAAPGNIRALLHAKEVRLFDFVQADGYSRRFRYLSKLEMPAGAFDLGNNLPPKKLTMLAPTVELVAHSDLHPALSDLLIEAAHEVHGRGTLFQAAGEFPAPLEHEYPISDDAARYYKSGKSISYRYLPFWLASLLDRALVVLVPILIVVVPGLRLAPALYGWRVKSRIYRRYGELMALERASIDRLTPEQHEALLDRLEEIEKSVISVKMPGAFADQIYILREHIKLVRERLANSKVSKIPSGQ